MLNLKLMYDLAEPEFFVEETLDESTGKTTKKYKIKGIYSTIGERNRNGRSYPEAEWRRVVES